VRIVLRVLGVDVLEVTTEPPDDGPPPGAKGDVTTIPVGFTPTPPDQRWEHGLEP